MEIWKIRVSLTLKHRTPTSGLSIKILNHVLPKKLRSTSVPQKRLNFKSRLPAVSPSLSRALPIATPKPIKHPWRLYLKLSQPPSERCTLPPSYPHANDTPTSTGSPVRANRRRCIARASSSQEERRPCSEVMIASADAADATDAICVQSGPKFQLEGRRPLE